MCKADQKGKLGKVGVGSNVNQTNLHGEWEVIYDHYRCQTKQKQDQK